MEPNKIFDELPYEVVHSKVLNAKGEPLVYIIPKVPPYVCGFNLKGENK